jgi:sugar lactone lactonase YvrE
LSPAASSSDAPPRGGARHSQGVESYVADTGKTRIQKFGPDRRFIRAWGSAGPGAEQVSVPVAIAVAANGRVYVSDKAGAIDVFNTEGTRLATWSGLSLPMGLTIDGEGNVWLADSKGGVIAFSPDGKRLATWDASGMRTGALDEPMGIAIDAQGRVYVSDRADRVQIFAPDGTFLAAWGQSGFEPGQFRGPIGLALDGQGDIYVTEDAGHRVQKFHLLPPIGP